MFDYLKIMDKRKQNEDFVDLMIKKGKVKEMAKPDSLSLISPIKKDKPIKPYLMDKDDESIKKIEDITKRIKEKVK